MMLGSILTILVAAQTKDQHVGPIDAQSAMLNTGQILAPYGQSTEFKGRPVDMRVLPGHILAVKDRDKLRFIDLSDLHERQELDIPGGASPTGMAVSKDGTKLFVTNSENKLIEYGLASEWTKTGEVLLPGPTGDKDVSFPCGIALSGDEKTAYVCLSRNNNLGIVDLASGKLVAQVPTGISPFEIEILNGRAFVTNQGGRRPKAGDKTSPSAGSDVVVDSKGLAATGTVSVVDLARRSHKAEIPVGLQPCAMAIHGETIFVANANGDSISIIDGKTAKETRRVVVRPDARLPFGSMPDGLHVSSDGKSLYAALAGNNAVAVMDLENPEQPRVTGFIPAGWYPAAVAEDSGNLLVLDNKGTGKRLSFRTAEKGMNSHDTIGGIQQFPVPDAATLQSTTESVWDLRNAPTMLHAYERNGEAKVAVPVPEELGQPSLIKHVVYVIKENRSYDQVFGDIAKGDGDKKLTVFGERVTPNQHALADQFVLLDNYYCNGVLSADGHSWATEGNVTPYLNRAFGGFNRSYTFGDDPITYSSSGFIWDGVLAAGLSYRNYGEMWGASLPKGVTAKEFRAGYRSGKVFDVPIVTGIDTIKRYSCPNFPGWDLDIPDQYRIDRFLTEFEADKKSGRFPNFVTIYLPQDHTGGPLGPEIDVADNDLAVGRLVDAISHSQFWKDTTIFVTEDDPQAGYDHVDGNRSTCLVVSPYTQTGKVVSNFYNQTSVLHTIQQIFAIAPLNQKVAAAPLMGACFSSTANTAPFEVKPAQVNLTELSKDKLAALRQFSRRVAMLDLRGHEVQGMRDMVSLNKAIWAYVKPGVPYPVHYAGAHGRGLKAKGLQLAMPGGADPDGD